MWTVWARQETGIHSCDGEAQNSDRQDCDPKETEVGSNCLTHWHGPGKYSQLSTSSSEATL